MWFGTKDGLNRFDGYTFKTFRNDPDDSLSLGFNFIYSLYEDSNGAIWVGSYKGLYKYDEYTETFSFVNAGLHDQISDIQMDSRGNLWVVSGSSLFRYNEHAHTLHNYTRKELFDLTAMRITPDGTLWLASSGGLLFKYDPVHDSFTSFNIFGKSKPASSKRIECIYPAGAASVLIGTSSQGAKLFNIITATYKDILSYNPDKTEIFVREFAQQSQNEYWIATESGIFIYNLQTGQISNLKKHYDDPYSISDNAVYTLCKDREGGMWAGTYFGGINFYPKQYTSFKKYFPKTEGNSVSGNAVREICRDNNNNLWIGTEDAGLNRLDVKTGVFTHFYPTGSRSSVAYSNIHGLLVTGNELWIGTFFHGLDVMNITTGKVIRHYNAGPGPNDLKGSFVVTLYQTRSGGILVGTEYGLYTYNTKSDDFSLIREVPENALIYTILEDDAGTIWVGTIGNGLYYFTPGTSRSGRFKFYDENKNSLGSKTLNNIFEDSNKNLWFATEGGGLCRYNAARKTFKRYTIKNGLPSNAVFKVLEDGRKNLWISTSRGLVCMDPVREDMRVYTRSDGLLSDQFNYNSGYKDATGKMYFGSLKGLISFNPDGFIKNTWLPPVYITGFQVDNKDLAIKKTGPVKQSLVFTRKVTLTHTQSSFSIDFAALSYTSPEMTKYAYKMNGLSNDWIYLKTNRKVYFTHLPPGNYLFSVKAANSSNSWTPKETTIAIEIMPPFWASWWAYLIYVLLAGLIIYFITRYYHQRTADKNQRRSELQQHEKEKEIYQAKIDFFTLIAHEIRTPLTLIKAPLEKVIDKASGIPEIKNNLQIMQRNTDRLVNLTSELLDFRKIESKGFTINPIRENISALVENIFLNFKALAELKNISYTVQLPNSTLYAFADTEGLTKILFNLFGNALSYAHSRVEIMLSAVTNTEEVFMIAVRNDGYLIPYQMKEKIFEPFFRLDETMELTGSGIGLALSRSLAELHKGTLELKEPEKNMNVFLLTLPLSN